MFDARESDHGEAVCDDLSDFVVVFVGVFDEGEGDVFGDVEGIEEGAHLEEESTASSEGHELAFVEGIDASAIEPDLTAVWAEESDDVLEHDGFSGAGGADDDDALAALDGEGDAVEDDEASEAFCDIAKFDDWDGHGCR